MTCICPAYMSFSLVRDSQQYGAGLQLQDLVIFTHLSEHISLPPRYGMHYFDHVVHHKAPPEEDTERMFEFDDCDDEKDNAAGR
jgi:hypothetical protein